MSKQVSHLDLSMRFAFIRFWSWSYVDLFAVRHQMFWYTLTHRLRMSTLVSISATEIGWHSASSQVMIRITYTVRLFWTAGPSQITQLTNITCTSTSTTPISFPYLILGWYFWWFVGQLKAATQQIILTLTSINICDICANSLVVQGWKCSSYFFIKIVWYSVSLNCCI